MVTQLKRWQIITEKLASNGKDRYCFSMKKTVMTFASTQDTMFSRNATGSQWSQSLSAALLAHLDIEVENKDEGKDGHALIVKGPSHRSGDVGGNNGREGSRHEACSLPSDLLHKEVGGQGAEGREEGRQEHADLHEAGLLIHSSLVDGWRIIRVQQQGIGAQADLRTWMSGIGALP